MKTINDQRADRCAKHLRHCGTDGSDDICLSDFLADARHWCDRHGIDPPPVTPSRFTERRMALTSVKTSDTAPTRAITTTQRGKK